MKRMAMVIGIKPEKIEEYKKLHASVWPEIQQKISECNITNYSVFLNEGENLLFGYWEYCGSDFDADMAKMSVDRRTQEWWDVCKPCQQPMKSRSSDEWWSMMEQVFHQN